MTAVEREHLLAEGSVGQALVLGNEPAAADRLISQLRLCADFKDGQRVEFHEELASLYQPAPDSPEARRLAEARESEQLRHPGRIPKIQLPVSAGQRVPVRYDPADRSRIVIDVPALQKRALHDYLQREKKPQSQPPAHQGAGTGPLWTVPTHCPNCGAPVDQARASQDRDPHCEFCHQPIPVQSARLSRGSLGLVEVFRGINHQSWLLAWRRRPTDGAAHR